MIDMRRSTVNRPEVGIANAREVGRRNPGAAVRCAHAQTVPVERLDDFSGQDGLELLGICALPLECLAF
jgi:hypothetical protein